MAHQLIPSLAVCGGFVVFIGFGMQASQYLFLDRVSVMSAYL